MSYKKAEALLALVIIARATSLLIIKLSLQGFTTFNLMALRFCIAFFCLLPFVRKRLSSIRKDTILRGGMLGSIFFIIIGLELKGLRMTNSSATVSFLENTAIVLVPLAEAALRRRLPHRQNLLSAALALMGVGFLILRGGRIELQPGILVCMCTATLYTSYIILTDRLAHRDDPLVLGFVIIGTAGLLSAVSSVLFEAPRLPETPREWVGILLLAVICGAIGTALQPMAQKYVPSEKACVFCALNPLSTCVMGWLFLNEWQGITGLIGAVLILASIILASVKLPEVNAARRPARNRSAERA